MLVSVIVNCYNGEKYLKQCIQSIIDQTYQSWEIIFWDNQSTDNSKNILFTFTDSRIKYFYAPSHERLYSSRNFALEKASGEIIAFLDTDDIWLPQKLEKQLILFRDPEIGVVCSNYFVINEKNNTSYLQYKYSNDHLISTNDLLYNYKVGLLTLVVKKKYLGMIYGPYFESSYNIIGDFALVLKLSLLCKIRYLGIPLGYYRIHNSNVTHIYKDELVNEFINWDNLDFTNSNFKRFKNYKNITSRINYYKSLKDIRNNEKLKVLNKGFFLISLKYKLVIICLLLLPNKLVKNFI